MSTDQLAKVKRGRAQEEQEYKCHIIHIPIEITKMIFQHLRPTDMLRSVEHVCKQWRSASSKGWLYVDMTDFASMQTTIAMVDQRLGQRLHPIICLV